jgi:hypothetical protein
MSWKRYTALGLVFVTPFGLLVVAMATAGERVPVPDASIHTAVLGAGSVQAVAAAKRDLWVHPRDDHYDPELHYKDSEGELYYHAENDIARGLGRIVVRGDGAQTVVSADLGRDLWAFVEQHGGSLRPVVHRDTDGDGRVDRTVAGRVDEGGAWFGGAELAEIDWVNGTWQLGIVYEAGAQGSAAYDGRYLASVSSREARVELPPVVADVGSGPPPGLVIRRHVGSAELDLAGFAADPRPYLEDFRELTRARDGDDWTVKPDGRGTLRTHFERPDLLLVQVTGQDTTLSVEWGDMPLEQYLSERLAVEPDEKGCYRSDRSRLVGADGRHDPVPNRILYCPAQATALFDAPDGYEIVMAAYAGDEWIESTEASTSVWDNFKLYAREVNTRSPRGRGTGKVGANIVAGFKAAGQDVADMGRHLVTGSRRTNIHTGQEERRTSLLAAVPMFLWNMARVKPATAVHDLFEGVSSGVQVAADAVSAVNNAVVNPLVQGTVGVASPDAADETAHWMGAVTQAWAKNLPGSERTFAAFSPMSLYQHDRAFNPTDHTRTDTQLNIDRVISAANMYGLYAIVASTSGGHGDGGGNSSPPGDGAGGGGAPPAGGTPPGAVPGGGPPPTPGGPPWNLPPGPPPAVPPGPPAGLPPGPPPVYCP